VEVDGELSPSTPLARVVDDDVAVGSDGEPMSIGSPHATTTAASAAIPMISVCLFMANLFIQ
ncbi:MAG: hypothetical protein R3246_16580, partial [Acidimicrobiia bacterium]|nr:hypothetical protein [Acidimicrobiia bacterium]